MNTLAPSDIANRLSPADVDALRQLDRGRRTDEAISLDRASVNRLINLELVRPDGVAFIITELGCQVLQHLR